MNEENAAQIYKLYLYNEITVGEYLPFSYTKNEWETQLTLPELAERAVLEFKSFEHPSLRVLGGKKEKQIRKNIIEWSDEPNTNNDGLIPQVIKINITELLKECPLKVYRFDMYQLFNWANISQSASDNSKEIGFTIEGAKVLILLNTERPVSFTKGDIKLLIKNIRHDLLENGKSEHREVIKSINARLREMLLIKNLDNDNLVTKNSKVARINKI